MAKHAKISLFNKKKFFIILFFTILLIILFVFRDNLISLFYNSDIVTTESSAIILDSQPETTVSESFIKTVLGAEYLEVSAFTLNCLSNSSEVSASIKNNSTETHNNLNLIITFLDENSNIVTTLNCPIKSIEPNEEKSTYGIVDLNL